MRKEGELELEKLVRQLDILVHRPGLFVDEHFSLLRNEIDVQAETLLEELSPESREAAEINSSRQALIDELAEHQTECFESLMNPKDLGSYQKVLDDLKSRIYREDPFTSEEESVDELVWLKDQLEDEILELSFAFLLRKKFVFIPEEPLGFLLTTENINLTQAEADWIK